MDVALTAPVGQPLGQTNAQSEIELSTQNPSSVAASGISSISQLGQSDSAFITSQLKLPPSQSFLSSLGAAWFPNEQLSSAEEGVRSFVAAFAQLGVRNLSRLGQDFETLVQNVVDADSSARAIGNPFTRVFSLNDLDLVDVDAVAPSLGSATALSNPISVLSGALGGGLSNLSPASIRGVVDAALEAIGVSSRESAVGGESDRAPEPVSFHASPAPFRSSETDRLPSRTSSMHAHRSPRSPVEPRRTPYESPARPSVEPKAPRRPEGLFGRFLSGFRGLLRRKRQSTGFLRENANFAT